MDAYKCYLVSMERSLPRTVNEGRFVQVGSFSSVRPFDTRTTIETYTAGTRVLINTVTHIWVSHASDAA